MKMKELAELTGQTPRNIRYLISENIVPKPSGTGKGAVYAQEHVEAITRYQSLRASGVTSISALREMMAGGGLRFLRPANGITVILSDELRVSDRSGFEDRLVAAVKQASDEYQGKD